MASKKFVTKAIENASKDLEKKGLIIGGSLLAVTVVGDLIGGLRTNSTRRAVAESLDGIDCALKRIEGAILPAPQPQPEEKKETEAAEGSENGPSNGGTK